MKVFKLVTLVIAFWVTACTQGLAADESYIMGDIDTLPADFYLNVTFQGNSTNTVHSVGVFKVERADGLGSSGKVYDLSLFRNGTMARMFPKKPLPFSISRNFRGLRDGEYRMTFVAKDQTGKIGKGSITIRVRH